MKNFILTVARAIPRLLPLALRIVPIIKRKPKSAVVLITIAIAVIAGLAFDVATAITITDIAVEVGEALSNDPVLGAL